MLIILFYIWLICFFVDFSIKYAWYRIELAIFSFPVQKKPEIFIKNFFQSRSYHIFLIKYHMKLAKMSMPHILKAFWVYINLKKYTWYHMKLAITGNTIPFSRLQTAVWEAVFVMIPYPACKFFPAFGLKIPLFSIFRNAETANTPFASACPPLPLFYRIKLAVYRLILSSNQGAF